MAAVKVGTASWTDKTLLASGWYPPGTESAEKRLAFYAEQFPLVEVDATYYSPPSEQTARLWVARTPEHFTFNVKAFSLLTHHPTKPTALYRDLRPPDAKKNLYLRDLEPATVEGVWERFVSALLPLWEAGKLGAVLFQFPQWFPISRQHKHYILECKRRAEPLPICVEFRNRTWMSEDNQTETLDFLTSYGLPYVCVDMPQGFPSSVPPVVAATTSELAVIRFHGHNAEEWESGSVQRRFAYLYTEEELAGWTPRIRELSEQARETHVVMNNCHGDYAQRNGRQLALMLRDSMEGARSPRD